MKKIIFGCAAILALLVFGFYKTVIPYEEFQMWIFYLICATFTTLIILDIAIISALHKKPKKDVVATKQKPVATEKQPKKRKPRSDKGKSRKKQTETEDSEIPESWRNKE